MRRDIDSVADIVGACLAITEYISGTTRNQFRDDRMRLDATVRELEIIGEATKRLSTDFRGSHPEVSWQKVAGMRDVLIHAYEIQVWDAATVDVPNLIAALKPLLPTSFFEETDAKD